MIASENFVPVSVLECQGSVLTNKYAEGYPGKRYYGGCEYVDIAEQLAIDRAKELFGAEHANVQPHSGAQANAAVYQALMEPGDTMLGLELAHGGHLTHGMKINFSGRLYEIAAYHVDRETSLIDMDEVERLAHERRPKVILAGWSAYPRFLDFERFRAIADAVGAYLVVDMAHFAGLVAAGLHPNPVPYADVVTTTTHKTIGGGRGGLILCTEELAKKIDSAVFPGQQGGPLEHVIAGKAVALRIAASEAFRERQERTVAGAQGASRASCSAPAAASTCSPAAPTCTWCCATCASPSSTASRPRIGCTAVGITVNRNAVPFDPRPPAVSSGLRIGTPALATRGLQEEDFAEVGRIIAEALHRGGLRRRAGRSSPRATAAIAERYPLYVRPAARPRRCSLELAVLDRLRSLGAMHYWDAVFAFLVAMAVAALLTPFAARLARRIGAIAMPSERGLAERTTPLLGRARDPRRRAGGGARSGCRRRSGCRTRGALGARRGRDGPHVGGAGRARA